MAGDLEGGRGADGSRTAADREAARQERERRRTARGGGASAPVMGPDAAPAPDHEREPAPIAASAPAAAEPPVPRGEAAAGDRLRPRRAAVRIGGAGTVGGAGIGGRRGGNGFRSGLLASLRGRRGAANGEHPGGDQSGEDAQPGRDGPPGDGGPADGRRRDGRLREGRGHRVGGGRHSLRARIGALASLVLVGVLVWLLVSLFQPFHGAGYGRVVVDIPQGTAGGQVGQILEEDGVVSSGFFFEARAFLDGKRGELHAGRFVMKHEMSYSAALAALTSGSAKVAVSKVVIPEGFTRPQIAAAARAAHLKGDYMKASRHVGGFDPRFYGAPAGTPDLEGFLFPATYEVKSHGSVQALVSDQLEAFHERFTDSLIRSAHALKLTPYQMLIVASMVEREAKLPHDRPLVAAVIYNRLHRGMPLGIDATIRFALHDYSKPLTEAQLHTPSPYNTRLHTGLPPTPISNPGMESIEAAAKPAHVGYLYYVDGADGCGDLVFANTEAEFEADSARYREALNANGGHLPACKHR